MNLINTTGITKPFLALGSAAIQTVAPVANLLEMANESTLAWTVSHRLDVAAKTAERDATRAATHADSLRKAIAAAHRVSLETNTFVATVQDEVDLDALRTRIHTAKRMQLHSLSDEAITLLSQRDNLTDADILRAAKVGFSAPVVDPADVTATPSDFDLSSFTLREI